MADDGFDPNSLFAGPDVDPHEVGLPEPEADDGEPKVVEITSGKPIGDEDKDRVSAVAALGFDPLDWSTVRYYGEAPPIEWLCEGTIPLGVPGLLAAMGGVGKSYLGLDLGLEIATAVAYGQGRKVLGGNVVAAGSVMILSAEDSKDSIHRRLAKIDDGTRREDANGRIFIVPLPEVGGPMPLIAGAAGEFTKTAKFEALIAILCRIPDLRLVVIDPLQAFVTADITKDPAAGQFMWSSFAQICALTGATTLGFHHMRKDGSKDIQTAADAREAIRGSTALVDGARVTYALWSAPEDEMERVCTEANVEPARQKVIHGAVVKANDEHDLEIHTYIRAESGLLIDGTEIGKMVKIRQDGLTNSQALQALREIDLRWGRKQPFSKAPQAVDRYLVNWIVHQFRVSPWAAKKQMGSWFAAGFLGDEEFDRHSKAKGLRVLKWPN